MIEFNGEQVQIKVLSIKHNLPWSTIKNRHNQGYRDDSLVLDRIHDTRFKGEKTTLAKIADDHDLPISLIKGRYALGLRDEALVTKNHRGVGSENAATKLDVEKVIKIKKLLVLTDLNQREISEMFDIDPSHVSDIKRGKRWAKVKIDLDELLPEAST